MRQTALLIGLEGGLGFKMSRLAILDESFFVPFSFLFTCDNSEKHTQGGSFGKSQKSIKGLTLNLVFLCWHWTCCVVRAAVRIPW